MLIDVLSPRDFTSFAIKDISGLIAFVGFVILIGTILGIIIDGIHHAIIQKHVFNNFIEVRKLSEVLKGLYPRTDVRILRSYFLKEDKALEIEQFINTNIYYYSEFYTNSFISLIPSSVIAPFYLFFVLKTPWNYSLSLGLILFFVACVILGQGYEYYKATFEWRYSTIFKYLGYNNYIHIEQKNYENSKFEVELEATIIDKVSHKPMFREVNINFKTTLGYFKTASGEHTPEITTTTNRQGKAEATLILDQGCVNNGIAIVIAISEKCFPGLSKVPKDRRVCIQPHFYLKKNLCLTITNIILVSVLAVATKEIFGLSFWDSAIIFLVGIFVGMAICCLIKDYLVDENVSGKLSMLDKIRKCLSTNAVGITMTFLATLFFSLLTLYFHTPSK